ncbi:putative porin, partial [Flavobacterium sp.]|uniref:putative porin n=1 Tax=Flavobacterium sp. TaxID=239 RepID=UPI003342CAC8
MKKQLLLIFTIAYLIFHGTDLFGQAIEMQSPKNAAADTTKVTKDTISKGTLLKIEPYLALDFFGINPFIHQPTPSKNKRDTLIYSTGQMDTTLVDVNNYRYNLQQFNLGEPGSPTYMGFDNASYFSKNGRAYFNSNAINMFNPMQIGLSPFDNNKYLRLHRAFAPFTKFKYLQGPGKTIAVNALHTQNFGARFNITLDYNSVTSQEQYVGSLQNNTHRNIHINQLSISKNGKYKQVVYLGWERGNRQENGGLASETDFFIPVDSSKFQIRPLGNYNPRLTTAKSLFSSHNHQLHQQYQIKKRLYITQAVSWEKTAYQFKDSKRDTNFYGKRYFETALKTNDSNVWQMITQAIGIKKSTDLFQFHVQHLYQAATYQSNLLRFTQNQKILNYQSVGLQLDGSLGLFRFPSMQFRAAYMYAGYAKNSHQLFGSFYLLRKSYHNNGSGIKFLHFNAEGQSQTTPASFFQQNFYSNHFIYNNKFELTGDKHLAGRVIFHNESDSSRKRMLGLFAVVRSGSWTNPILSLDSLPFTQFGSQPYKQVEMNFSMRGKRLYFNQTSNIKKFNSSLPTIFNMGQPVLRTTTTLEYKMPAFKKAMILTLGINIQYTSKFQNTTYRPDAGSFIVHSNLTNLGNYFELDLYAVAKVQTLDIFLKAEHINEIFVIPG